MNNEKFRSLVGNHMRNFQSAPPAGVWEYIEKELNRRRRRTVLIRISAAAATLLLLITIGLNYLNQESANQQLSPSNNQTKASHSSAKNNKGELALKADVADDMPISQGIKASKGIKASQDIKVSQGIEVSKGTEVSHGTEVSQGAEESKGIEVSQGAEVSQDIELAEQDVAQNIRIIENSDSLSKISTIPPGMYINNETLAELATGKVADIATGDNSADRHWNISLAYGTGTGADYSGTEITNTTDRGGYSYDEFMARLANETNYYEEIDNTIHEAPLTLGLMFDIGLSQRLRLETGLTYSKLAFKVKTDVLDPFYREYRNEIYYLGLPLGIRYNFVQKRVFDLYILQWVVLEKGIKGSAFSDIYLNENLESSDNKNYPIKGVQLSSVTGFGGQFKLNRSVFLFLQGGAQIFYLNQTQPYNLRSSKMVWPSVQTGIRLKLGK